MWVSQNVFKFALNLPFHKLKICYNTYAYFHYSVAATFYTVSIDCFVASLNICKFH